MKVEIDLPVIEGYEYTGEYRRAEINEPYECNGVRILHTPKATTRSYHILKKKAPKYKTLKEVESEEKYVEIKALEDALELSSGMIMTDNDIAIYKELYSLLN